MREAKSEGNLDLAYLLDDHAIPDVVECMEKICKLGGVKKKLAREMIRFEEEEEDDGDVFEEGARWNASVILGLEEEVKSLEEQVNGWEGMVQIWRRQLE
jgi:hypothetical protein